jgi:hypothetical protein
MTPSVEITAPVETVVPFESRMACEVRASGVSRGPVAVMPRGGVAG